MLLQDLSPSFVKILISGQLYHDVDTLEEAQGIRFLCPKCFAANGEVGTHCVQVWVEGRGAGAKEEPFPGRWKVSGTSVKDLTLSPSVQLTSGCGWHGHVINGEVRG